MVQELTNGKGVDLVVDGVGKETFDKSQEAARIHGWVITYGFSSGSPEALVTDAFQRRALRIGTGKLFTYVATREEYQRRFRAVVDGIREGWFAIHHGPEVSPAKAANAHRQIEGRSTTGKLLLKAR